MAINARFLPEDFPLLHSLKNGLQYVYADRIYTLPWETTFNQLAQLPFVQRRGHHAFGWPVYHINAPLRLGQLEVESLEINTPDVSPQSRIRNDVPIDHFSFEVRLVEHGTDGYWQLKQYINQTLGPPEQMWERTNDQFHASWVYDGLQLSVTYWFKQTVRRTDWEYTSLSIANNRVFPQYLTDAYTQQFVLNAQTVQWHTFSIPNASVPHNYRTSSCVRFTPEPLRHLLQERQHNLAIWFSQQERILGIALPDYALILSTLHRAQLALETIDLDRGRYEDELTIRRVNEETQVLATGPVGTLTPILNILKKWLTDK